MKFREHRGQLDDSLATTVEISDRASLVAHTQKLLGPYGIDVRPRALHVLPYTFDARTGWDTHIVTLDDYGVLGFTDSQLPEETLEEAIAVERSSLMHVPGEARCDPANMPNDPLAPLVKDALDGFSRR